MSTKQAPQDPSIISEEWWPRHPLGGEYIYLDSQSHDWIAKFLDHARCERAIDCHEACRGIPDPKAAIEGAKRALELCVAEIRRLSDNTDRLLNHCPACECEECSKIVCPHGEPLHLHHDGCPACAQDENEFPTDAALNAASGALASLTPSQEKEGV